MLKESPNTVFTVFRINIRGFKIINEIYGFPRGNEVLVQITDKLKKEIGERGAYGRLYSDHFAVCYPIAQSEIRKDAGLNTFYLECGGQRIRVELRVKGSELVEFDFMADYFNTGSYGWFHSRQQSYGTGSIDNRIVGIITRTKSF